MAETDRPQMTI